jgi:hypothetical protein
MATAGAIASQDDDQNRYRVIPLSRIRMDGGTQPREGLSNDNIIEFAESMTGGATFPPVVVFYDGMAYWLADGFHRANAAKRARLSAINCDVRMGSQRDAVLYGCGANADHGVRRTNADKRRAIMRMLNDDEWGTWTDSRIAEYCKVTPQTVGSYRVYALNPSAQSPFRKAIRQGKEVVVDTREMGRHARPALKIKEDTAGPIPAPAAEPTQRTASNPIHEFSRSLKRADIEFRENVKTDFGLIMFETDDAIYQVVPMLSAAAFREAFATILFQRKQHAPAKRAVIVGRLMDDARPWVALARHWKVEVKGLG